MRRRRRRRRKKGLESKNLFDFFDFAVKISFKAWQFPGT
jgi:hypothetical protein